MPPKKKGQNVRGRDKIFRHAVEHVHVGLGHSVLGNLSLQLAAGPPSSSLRSAADTATTVLDDRRPAFYLELNEQLLSHSSKDYKRFRWEVVEMCETRPLFQLHHRRIAEKLLLALMDRSGGGAFSHKSKKDHIGEESERGGTTEGFEAFARLTIAFARDMQERFFPYFEVFQQAVCAGLYDKAGQLIVDTNRLQLVYGVQAAWCREMAPYWCLPAHRSLVRRVVQLYVRQMHDTKEYIRRLSAELLAFLSRLSRPLVSLVVEEATGDVLASYEQAAAVRVSSKAQASSADNEASEEDEVVAVADASEGAGEEPATVPEQELSLERRQAANKEVWDSAYVAAYAREQLASHPVVDSLAFYTAELFRGITGSLNSSFESAYVMLLEGFGLLCEEAAKAVVAADPALYSPYGLDNDDDVDNAAGNSEDPERPVAASSGRNAAPFDPQCTSIHAVRWAHVFAAARAAEKARPTTTSPTSTAPSPAEEAGGKAVVEGASCADPELARVAATLVRRTGELALASALQAVLQETKKHSESGHMDGEEAADEEGALVDTEDGAALSLAVGASSAQDDYRPSHRLLSAVVHCLQPTSAEHIHLLSALLRSADCFLWRDHRELPLLRSAAQALLHSVRSPSAVTVDSLAALLELLCPLCVAPYTMLVPDVRAPTELQRQFLPVAKAAVASLVAIGGGGTVVDATQRAPAPKKDVDEADPAIVVAEQAQVVMLAFVQDVLQKNYAFCRAEEREIAEAADVGAYRQSSDDDAGDSGEDDDSEEEEREEAFVPEDGQQPQLSSSSPSSSTALGRRRRRCAGDRKRRQQHVVHSQLTPLALTLLHRICSAAWSSANAALEQATASFSRGSLAEAQSVALRRREVQRAVLLARLAHDRTRHMESSPLQQLLRLRPLKAASASVKGAGEVAGAELSRLLEGLLLHLVQLFLAVQKVERVATTTITTFSVAESAELLSGALPLVQVTLQLLPGTTASSSSSGGSGQSARQVAVVERTAADGRHAPLKDALFAVLQAVHDSEMASSAAAAVSANAARYAVFAQVSALVVHLVAQDESAAMVVAVATVAGSERKPKSKKKRLPQPTDGSSEAGSMAEALQSRRKVGLRYLAETIALLAKGFTEEGAAVSDPAAGVSADWQALSTVSASADVDRTRLLQGAEQLLQSLLWVLGLSGTRGGEEAMQESRDDENKESGVPSPATRAALATLKRDLPESTQAQFIRGILLEALVSSSQSLRVLTLRLLRLLCHPALTEATERLSGVGAVDPRFFTALLQAERFNPLALHGNLDGFRQALAHVTFSAEAGTLTDPFERNVLARAMIGLLHIRFADVWALAMKVLVALVRREKTAKKDPTKDTDAVAANEEGDTAGNGVTTALQTSASLAPVVWNDVVCRYAHLLVLGDADTGSSSSVGGGKSASAAEDRHASLVRTPAEVVTLTTTTTTTTAEVPELLSEAVADAESTLDALPCLYVVSFADHQRHEKGELVSRAFAAAQFTTASVTLVDMTQAEDEVLTWRQHGVLLAAPAAGQQTRSTDRATIAQTFLGALEEMMKATHSARDTKLRLVEDLVLELVAIQNKEHPRGWTQLKRLEDRLCLAMRALSVAPSTAQASKDTTVARAGANGEQRTATQHRNAVLEDVFVSFIFDTNARLQRVALDNLKRLKIQPFSRYHAQLLPYCDSTKNLFGFLATFHVDTDVAPADRADYVSAALTLALPKLIAKVSKEKLRDQAVLSRRLMSLLVHIPTSSKGVQVDGLTEVLRKLVQRVVFAGVASVTAATTTTTTAHDVDDVAQFDFLATWNRAVQERRNHCTRSLERLVKQLWNTMRLLEALLHAVGQRFASYVRPCMHLALQAYLLANKQLLRKPVDAVLAAQPQTGTEDDGDGDGAQQQRALGWVTFVQRTLNSGAFSLALSHLRRASLTVVALLFEQFPSESMAVVREDVQQQPHQGLRSAGASASINGSLLLGRYMAMLSANSKGVTQDGGSAAAAGAPSGARGTKSYVTPVLRLVKAWVQHPVLLPLLPAFADAAVDALGEVFAVNTHSVPLGNGRRSAPVHRASAQAVLEGLQCVSDILAASEEPVELLVPMTAVVEAGAKREKEKERKKTKRSLSVATKTTTASTTTLRHAFVDTHILPIFATLYRLIVSGDDGDERDEDGGGTRGAGKGRDKAQTAASTTQHRFSVMSFSVSMWREIMHTVSLLTAYLADLDDSAAQTLSEATTVPAMLGRLLEIALRFVTHPVCATDGSTAQMATQMADTLVQQLPPSAISYARHYRPLVHLFNVVTNPTARLSLCGTLRRVAAKLPIENTSTRYHVDASADPARTSAAFTAQMEAASRAVACLNSFEDGNESLDRYDFELRFHTYHALIQFFNSNINDRHRNRMGTGRTNTGGEKKEGEEVAEATGGDEQSVLRHRRDDGKSQEPLRQERDYSGEQDVHIPTDKTYAPVLCIEALNMLVANTLFFLRDPESTVRALSAQLLQAMLGYATRPAQNRVKGATAATPAPMDVNSAGPESTSSYARLVLDEVVRREVLASLRRGVVARDVHIRNTHMASFGGLARYYAESFPSFARLYSPNSDKNFYLNVGHVQPKPRLHALALLRQEAPQMAVRDLLRVFVPFLMSAVKDYAQGKRDLQNLTEGRAKGYCDAVLLTIATIAEKLPWEAYYRVLSLFLSNASANASLRMPMLRGVVQVLHHFHFLNEEDPQSGTTTTTATTTTAAAPTPATAAPAANAVGGEDDDDDDDDVEDDDEAVLAAIRAKRRQFRHARIMQVLEGDILPQLFAFIAEGKQGKKAIGLASGEMRGNAHSITAVRQEQEKEDQAVTKNAILQLPVAIAVTRIVKSFPEDRFNHYVDHLLDEVIVKLRTKKDKHRESARRILGVMLQETGPAKLRFVITKLQDNLVHGYQLHVLGYTVVTLLFQLYEPHTLQSATSHHHQQRAVASARRLGAALSSHHRSDPVQEALDEARQLRHKGEKGDTAAAAGERRGRAGGDSEAAQDVAVEQAEEELLAELAPNVRFDYQYGVDCLTALLDPLMRIFLDDYLGEVGLQKEQVELMSTMIEVKQNRAVQGFVFLARHCEAGTVMNAFLERMTWVLTPPSDVNVDVANLTGSERARSILMNELRSKYLTVSKNASADIVFVNKVRLLAVRVARGLLTNPTMQVQASFEQVRDLLHKHNVVREEKTRAFEAKDGTRRIRGNAHRILHGAERHSWKEQLDSNFLVQAEPERVDVDFSTHTVLATQQKQKLRMYKGRYGKVVKEAAKDFYREDPTTAVVLDTLDEFLLKYLLSVLKQVLGIGREKKLSKAAVKLDLLRRRRDTSTEVELEEANEDADDDTTNAEGKDDAEEAESAEADKEADGRGEDGDDDDLQPQPIDEDQEDALDAFAAQQQQEEEADNDARDGAGQVVEQSRSAAKGSVAGKRSAASRAAAAAAAAMRDLNSAFTREHRELLESMVPVVLTTLQGEGSDPVVANALDCLLALISLRPPLSAVKVLEGQLFDTVVSFFERGGPIKQRAMRVCAAVVSHQQFTLTEAQAVRLVLLARAEITDRSEFLPMALGLFYAVLGKHVALVEVYDLVDVITELLVHLGAKGVIRNRCVLILVRFLTEYKLTPDKFRSHVDLLCKNLDYPELSGRLALLDVLDTLTMRLPTVVLRAEAPVLLVPLSATLHGAEWRECRERAGQVLQNLAKNAGVDVLVPLLSTWLAPSQPRPTRTMAAQAWAVMIPTLASLYQLHSGGAEGGEEEEEQVASDRDAFAACCRWSLPGVLAGCLYDQFAAAGSRKGFDDLRGKVRQGMERKGWTYLYFSLRCAEAMVVASPEVMYPLLAPELVPRVVERLVLHSHPWVHSAALRLLRHYCYTFVEAQCAYLQDDPMSLLRLSRDDSAEGEAVNGLPFILHPAHTAGSSSSSTVLVGRAKAVLQELTTLVKRLLTAVGLSDVSNEKYTAHRAMDDPARAELLKVLVYATRATYQVSLAILLSSPSRGSTGAAPSASAARYVRHQLQPLLHQVQSLAAPIIQQGSVVNYMVRTATLTQYLGGVVSLLPRDVAVEDGAEGTTVEPEAGAASSAAMAPAHRDAYSFAVRWLVHRGFPVLALTQRTVVPLVGVAIAASTVSEKLSGLGAQVSSVVQAQLEERRTLLAPFTSGDGVVETDLMDVAEKPAKKQRKEGAESEDVTLDTVLTAFTTTVAGMREERRLMQITRDTTKVLKRNRRQMEKEEEAAAKGSMRRAHSTGGGTVHMRTGKKPIAGSAGKRKPGKRSREE